MATELDARLSEPQLRQRLEPHLRRQSGPATLGDIVAGTGLPSEQTESVLRRMLDEYNGRIQVDEKGELVYSFPHGLRPRQQTTKEFLAEVIATLYGWFKVAYKVGIFLILILYFVVFFVIMVALFVAMVAVNSSSDSGLDLDGCGDGCDGCGEGLGDGCWVASNVIPAPDMTVTSRHHRPGRFQRTGPNPYQAKPKAATKSPPFWMQAYEFVFGEDQPKPDPTRLERELVAYLRDRQGRVTLTDIVALTGQTADEAEGILNHLMAAHDGDIEVSDEGVLVYTFDKLMVSTATPGKGQSKSRRWSWWWERPEAPLVLNRNSEGTNIALGFLNTFNLAWSAFFTFGMTDSLLNPSDVLLYLLLGPLPFVFSVLFFGIPLLRKLRLDKLNRLRAWRNQLREAARKVFQLHIGKRNAPPLAPEELVQYHREPGDRILSAAQMNAVLEDLKSRWRGRREAGARGPVYSFDELREALIAGVKAREQVDPSQWQVGPLAYDTDDEQVEEAAEWQERMRGDEPTE